FYQLFKQAIDLDLTETSVSKTLQLELREFFHSNNEYQRELKSCIEMKNQMKLMELLSQEKYQQEASSKMIESALNSDNIELIDFIISFCNKSEQFKQTVFGIINKKSLHQYVINQQRELVAILLKQGIFL